MIVAVQTKLTIQEETLVVRRIDSPRELGGRDERDSLEKKVLNGIVIYYWLIPGEEDVHTNAFMFNKLFWANFLKKWKRINDIQEVHVIEPFHTFQGLTFLFIIFQKVIQYFCMFASNVMRQKYQVLFL